MDGASDTCQGSDESFVSLRGDCTECRTRLLTTVGSQLFRSRLSGLLVSNRKRQSLSCHHRSCGRHVAHRLHQLPPPEYSRPEAGRDGRANWLRLFLPYPQPAGREQDEKIEVRAWSS